MPKPRKSAEEVCIEYAIAAVAVRDITRKITPGECALLVAEEAIPWHMRDEKPAVPCISKLLSLKPEVGHNYGAYLEESQEIEDEMCERCQESLKAVRDRKLLRKRLGAAKRSVEAVGKRLQKEGKYGIQQPK